MSYSLEGMEGLKLGLLAPTGREEGWVRFLPGQFSVDHTRNVW